MRTTDLLVVGSGPAGLGAAIEGARCGAWVLLVDENHKAGGQLYKQIHKFFGSGAHYAGTRGFQIADLLLREASGLGVETLLDTRALGLLDDGRVAVLHGGVVEAVEAKKVILATGAKENALAFPGWTLPGVMTAGAAQTFSNVHGTLVGKRILMVGSGNVGLIVSYQLMQAGAEISALVEAAPRITGYLVHAGKIQRAGVPVYTSHTVVEARGTDRVEEAVIAQVDEYFQPIPGTEQTIPVDTILLAVGLNPRIELASMFHCKTTFEGGLGGLLPSTMPGCAAQSQTSMSAVTWPAWRRPTPPWTKGGWPGSTRPVRCCMKSRRRPGRICPPFRRACTPCAAGPTPPAA